MTAIKYLLSTGVATTAEIMQLNREDKPGYKLLMQWAKEQAEKQGVTIEEPAKA